MAGLILSLCVACQPSDQKAKTVKQRLDAGETVVFSEPGYRRPSCSQRSPDWSNVALNDEDERGRIVLSKQNSFLSPGPRTCYRVGSTIDLGVYGRDIKGGGRVRITRLSLVRMDKLDKRSLKGAFFSSNDAFNRYRDALKPRMRPEYGDIITIVDFVYLSGSAVDESDIRQKDQDKNTGDGYEETTNAGDTLSSCNKPWSDVAVPAELLDAVRSGAIKSWYQLGERNCFAQGQTAALKTGVGAGSPAVAQIRLTKLKRFRISAIDAKFFNLPDYDFTAVRDRVLRDNTNRHEEFMTVVDFDLVEETP
jgi:hypothetical protein